MIIQETTIENLLSEREDLYALIDLYEKTLRDIAGSCGMPDAAEACRVIIKRVKEVLPKEKW